MIYKIIELIAVFIPLIIISVNLKKHSILWIKEKKSQYFFIILSISSLIIIFSNLINIYFLNKDSDKIILINENLNLNLKLQEKINADLFIKQKLIEEKLLYLQKKEKNKQNAIMEHLKKLGELTNSIYDIEIKLAELKKENLLLIQEQKDNIIKKNKMNLFTIIGLFGMNRSKLEAKINEIEIKNQSLKKNITDLENKNNIILLEIKKIYDEMEALSKTY